jgi:hypothetical protein
MPKKFERRILRRRTVRATKSPAKNFPGEKFSGEELSGKELSGNPRNIFRDEFLSFSVSFDCWPAKKVRKSKNKGNQREFVAN